ncbi:ACT domain-containing protein [Sphingomicrobium arenosum]|uniref:ACT domain-containing protein n=1 Tax=Sphingomicrobium arenosum TaxID=2233861 RepID=UPI00223F2F8E|nr:ACT domain-containing protein [Sphingomicrobium arenosum]
MVGLRPLLDPEQHGFATIDRRDPWPEALVPVALFEEAEGTSVIAPLSMLDSLDLDPVGGWALITLGFDSRLDGVGLTARVSTALASANIPCNVVAAFHHDHLFVPWAKRADVMAILDNLEAP